MVFLVVQILQSLGTVPGMPLRAPAIFSYAVYGSILVGIMLVLPQGVIPALRSAFRVPNSGSAKNAERGTRNTEAV